jgi:hypothetical protein
MQNSILKITIAGLLLALTTGVSFSDGSDFLPSQLWLETEGYVVVEAENIDHHENWAVKKSPDGFTGTGYCKWIGPQAPGRGNDDYTGERQHPRNTHLILRVLITSPGAYRIDVRNIHEKEDGDNDAWVNILGRKADTRWPIKRIGDSHKDGSGFTWADWGHRTFFLDTGENRLYLGGRSVGFGIDRIALWLDKYSDADSKAHDLNTAQSSTAGTDTIRPEKSTLTIYSLHATDFPWKKSGYRRFPPDPAMIELPAGDSRKTPVDMSVVFNGESGLYSVSLTYLGMSTAPTQYTVSAGNQQITDTKTWKPSSSECAAMYADSVSISKSDTITVSALPDSGAAAVWRAVTFRKIGKE